MFVRIRPLRKGDGEKLIQFSKSASLGIINLPATEERAKQLTDLSLQSFAKEIIQPHNEFYCFILEEFPSGNIIGTSSIMARAGTIQPYCTFYLENNPIGMKDAFPVLKYALLYPRNYAFGPSELCALFLLPDYRKMGFGRLLSLSRGLFIAAFPWRFEERFIAELRGVITSNNYCPFWDALLGKLLHMSFKEIFDYMKKEQLNIAELLPPYPIHWSLLPEEAQKAVGSIHPNTKPVMHLLMRQGFRFFQEISILDGGPILSAPQSAISTVTHSEIIEIGRIIKHIDVDNSVYLIGNDKIDFRCCQSSLFFEKDGTVTVDELTAQALEVDIGNVVRYYK